MGLPFDEESNVVNGRKSVGSPTKLPLLFFLGELSGETNHFFFDPLRNTFDTVRFQELDCQAECLASRFGWLLILSRETSSIFFFNPLTGRRIDLPYSDRIITAAAFSAPPTSPDCTVYAIKSYTAINAKFCIDTFRMGQKNWISRVYRFSFKTLMSNVVQAVCSRGVLYCVDSKGKVGAFDVKEGYWSVFQCQKFRKFYTPHLVEFEGDIFAVKKETSGAIEKVYKLKLEPGKAAWMEEDLGDISLFLAPYGSCGVADLDEKKKLRTLFVANHGPESKCVSYDVEGRDYRRTRTYRGGSSSWCHTPVWIER